MRDFDNELNGLCRNGFIKSIQRGSLNVSGVTSASATITPVDPNNAYVVHLGLWAGDASSDMTLTPINIALANSTSILGTKNAAAGTAFVYFEVIEFYPGVIRSIQRGSISVSGAASATATINPVNMAKTSIVPGGYYFNQTRTDLSYARVQLTNSTTVTATFGNDPTVGHVTYQVVEFF